MKSIYDLYDALLTIKDHCASKETAPSNWKLVEPTRRLCK